MQMSKPVRRSQAISPFGIGALVDFPGPVSLIHAGLDAWRYDETSGAHHEFRISDERRLARRLGVDYFVEPPDFRLPRQGHTGIMPNEGLKLPFLRFPLWHSCPRCGRMWEAKLNDASPPICKGPIGTGKGSGEAHSPRKTVQVRFVAACAEGHLQDFPWVEWLFKSTDSGWQPNNSSKWLRIRSTGSASLTGIEVRAEQLTSNNQVEVVRRGTLGNAFMSDETDEAGGAFSKVGIRCAGYNPVLGIVRNSGRQGIFCGQQLKPILRGASNLYFPIVESSIYIPDVVDSSLDPKILDLLDDFKFQLLLKQIAFNSDDGLVTLKGVRNALKLYAPENDSDPVLVANAANKYLLVTFLFSESKVKTYLAQKIKATEPQELTLDLLQQAIRMFHSEWDIQPELLLDPVKKVIDEELSSTDFLKTERVDSVFSTNDYRRQEYEVFCRDQHDGFPRLNLLIKSKPISGYDAIVVDAFERISLLHRLRETRAFVGFSRLYPRDDLTPIERWSLISQEQRRWLPATVVHGEGIFFKFKETQISSWLESFGVYHEGRLSSVNQSLNQLREQRHMSEVIVTPKKLLIHTFSHLLINELVYECGYGSASLRERIYCSEGVNQMSGVLIYTAAGDTEGSMGGLVEMGKPNKLEKVILQAIERASWCSSDPLCIESRGQGPGSCNLAACHSCALIPETSCEEQNRLLDRGVVVGTISEPKSGFFSAR
jgi:hypothetical protein